jgi:hypothetical protein
MEYCDPEIEEMSARRKRRMARYDERSRLLKEITSISSQMLEETKRMTSRMWSDADERAKLRERRDQLREWQNQLKRDDARLDQEQKDEDALPPPIADAINILRNEKVRRWEDGYGLGDKYNRAAQKIADGARDRQKQAALYVEVDSTGKVSSRPERIDEAAVVSAVERARRLRWFLHGLPEHAFENGLESRRVVRALRLVFATSE